MAPAVSHWQAPGQTEIPLQCEEQVEKWGFMAHTDDSAERHYLYNLSSPLQYKSKCALPCLSTANTCTDTLPPPCPCTHAVLTVQQQPHEKPSSPAALIGWPPTSLVLLMLWWQLVAGQQFRFSSVLHLHSLFPCQTKTCACLRPFGGLRTNILHTALLRMMGREGAGLSCRGSVILASVTWLC